MVNLGKAIYDQNDPPPLEECHTVLRKCPVMRMGMIFPHECFKNGEVIPKNDCIGCGICVKHSDKIKMTHPEGININNDINDNKKISIAS